MKNKKIEKKIKQEWVGRIDPTKLTQIEDEFDDMDDLEDDDIVLSKYDKHDDTYKHI